VSTFGELLRTYRDASLLSQKELAEKAKVSVEAISLWERDRAVPREDSARRLAEALNLAGDEFSRFVEAARRDRRQARRDMPSAQADAPQVAPTVHPGRGEPGLPLTLLAIGGAGALGAALVLGLGLLLGRGQFSVAAPPTVTSLRDTTGTIGSPPCADTLCNGLDPGVTGCAIRTGTPDRVEVTDDRGTTVGWVELRWSELCQTNWSRLENLTGDASLPLRAYLRDEAGAVLEATTVLESSRGIYSNMWFAPTGKIRVKACGVIGEYAEVCTGLH